MRTPTRTTTLIVAGLAGLALTLAACGTDADSADTPTTPAAEATQAGTPGDGATPAGRAQTMDAAATQGTFTAANGKHVEGTVTVEDGTVMLSGFSADEAPDLRLYLANGSDGAAVAAGTELGKVAFDEADQTFALDGADPGDFTDVVVYCLKAKATFGTAALA